MEDKELNYLYESRKSYLKEKLYHSEITLDEYAKSLENYRMFLSNIIKEVNYDNKWWRVWICSH